MDPFVSIKYISGAIIVVILLLLGIYITRIGIAPFTSIKSSEKSDASVSGPSVQINDTIIPVEIAKGVVAVQKGLSGRPSLASGTGMFFIFKNPGIYPFWMPNMHFPIDIVWIAHGKVVGIEHSVSHEFNPLHPRTYVPPEPIAYVLEVNSGFAEAQGIHIGDAVIMHGIE